MHDHAMQFSNAPLVPVRSRLYHLKPIGLGTAMVESLSGYISRLAQQHCVCERDLLLHELLPDLGKDYLLHTQNQNISAFWKDVPAINSVNASTRDWIRVLEKLTLSDNLHCLTMLAWSEVLSPKDLPRRSKAWCPSCYEEWRKNGLEIYDPLIWGLEAAAVCTQHDRYLDTRCPNPNCRKRLNMLAPHIRPGYCYHCDYWLGASAEPVLSQMLAQSEMEWHRWSVQAVGELLAATPTISRAPNRSQFANCVAAYLQDAYDGNVSACARKLCVSRRTIRDWKRDEQVPELRSLLGFCYLVGVSPLHLFTGGAADVHHNEACPSTSPGLMLKAMQHHRVFDAEQVRRALEAELALEVEPPNSMSAVAKRLNYDHSFLYKHFPELCRAISDRYRAYRKRKREERKRQILDEVRQTTYRVHEQELYPSQERVRLLLAKPGSIKEPGALAAWHGALQELGWEAG
jgi:hypothetical protein